MLSALIGAGASIIGAGLQYGAARRGQDMAQEANEKNIQAQKEINQQNIDFTQKENIIQRQREDTAISRQMQDMASAGLNPLLAGAGGGASATPGQIPLLQAEQFDTSVGTNFAEQTQNAIGTAVNGTQQLGKAINEAIELKIKQKEADIKEQELKIKKDLADSTIKVGDKTMEKINEEINSMQALTDKQKEETKLVTQEILLKPIQKALIEKQKDLTTEQIKETKKRLELIDKEKAKLAAERSQIIANTNLTLETQKKIQEEVKNLIITGNIQAFEEKMKETTYGIDKSTEIVKAITDIASIFIKK